MQKDNTTKLMANTMKRNGRWLATICLCGLPVMEQRVYVGMDLKPDGYTYEYEFTVSGRTKRESLMALRERLKTDMERWGKEHLNYPILAFQFSKVSEYILDRPSCRVK